MWLKRVAARTFDLIGTGSDDCGTWSQPAQQSMATNGQRLLTPSSAKLSADTRLGPDSFPTERLARSIRASYRISPTGHRPDGRMTVVRYCPSVSELVSCPGLVTDDLVLTTGLIQLRPALVGWSNALWLTTSIPPLPPASVLYWRYVREDVRAARRKSLHWDETHGNTRPLFDDVTLTSTQSAARTHVFYLW